MANFGLEEAARAASLAATGIGAIGALAGPAAQAANAHYQALVARNNQAIVEQNARLARQRRG